MPSKIYITTFCNRAHRMKDGRPVNHECYVLKTAALRAEVAGTLAEYIASGKPIRTDRIDSGKPRDL